MKEIEKKDHFYGCVEFPVQISDDFKRHLEEQLKIEIENMQGQSERSSLPSSEVSDSTQILSSKVSSE